MGEWYHIRDVDQLDSPALVVYPARVKENIRNAIEMVGGNTERLRPHIKTHKSPNVTRLLLDAGIRQFKCATIAEAEMLAICGAPDILLAYQPVGPKLQRFLALIRQYPSSAFSCLIDNAEAAKELSAAITGRQLQVTVYIDLNVGMNRTGIIPGPGALELFRLATGLPGIRPVGLHAYDGHLRDHDLDLRKQKCDAAFAPVAALRDELLDKLGINPIIIAGGSPSFSIHCGREGVVCSPGTFIYWDKGYSEACPEQPFKPAALVITRVVSLPGDDRLCLDLGHKSIAPENELGRRVHFLGTNDLKPLGQSEEHLVMATEPGHSYRPGDLLYGLPIHICPTVALYERAYTIEDGRCSGEWSNQARDRKINI